MKIHFIQHVPFEGLGMIADWAKLRAHTLSSTAIYEKGASLPVIETFDALIIMGGPMSVYDEGIYPWLSEEKRFIRATIEAEKHVLGICLGAQLIASCLNAKVTPHTQKEIGWFPVTVEDAAVAHPILSGLNYAMTVFHWHGDRFEIPVGALHLMSSIACDNQAFLYGKRVLGLQFHLEMDGTAIDAIIHNCKHELIAGECVQSEETIRQTVVNHTRSNLFTLLDNWSGA